MSVYPKNKNKTKICCLSNRKKKKKKSKEKDKKHLEQISSTDAQETEANTNQANWRAKRTKAEIAFERATAKRVGSL